MCTKPRTFINKIYSIYFLVPTFRPDLVDYSTLRPSQHIHNLNNAFDIAEKELGLPRLLDAEGALILGYSKQ